MKTEKELKEIIKKSKRPCGSCGEVDTMLFCCECLREIREKDENKRNIEVKQAIEELINTRVYGTARKLESKRTIVNLFAKELLQKLGLGEGK